MNTPVNNIYVNAASQLAYKICRDAIWHKDACNWIGTGGDEYMGMPKSFARTLQTNFYDGTAGVAFFLVNLHRVNPDELVRETAEGALRQIVSKSKEAPENDYGRLGFYSGYCGEAFVLMKAAEILDKKEYYEAAVVLIEKIIQLPSTSWNLDIIDGAAGAIPCLLQLYRYYPEKKLLQFILSLGEYLVSEAKKENNHLAWDTMPGTEHPLTGFGHGAAGIASAFLELFAHTTDERFFAVAQKAFEYENEHFNHQQQNWPDFRNHPGMYDQSQHHHEKDTPCGNAWCHGAPGIALSRLRAYELTKQAAFLQDAEKAVNTTMKQFDLNQLGNYSLCHGLFGNAETLLYGAEVLQRKDLAVLAEKAILDSIEQVFSKGLPVANGLHNLFDTPDFMLGTSGMGYFFLRMYDSKMFPSVLLLKS